MRNLAKLCFSLLILTFLVTPAPVFSQPAAFDFNRAYKDYQYMFQRYREAHQEYTAAKTAYKTYQTLTAKTEATEKTLKMLQFRDEVVRTYLTAIRMRLAEATGISNYEQNLLYLKLDNEVNWYADHRDSLSSAGDLEDLLAASAKTESRYYQSELLAYQTLVSIVAGKEEILRETLRFEIDEIKNKLAEIRQKGDKDTAILERWILEAENKLTRSQEKQYEAQQIFAQMKPKTQSKMTAYNQARSRLQQSHQYLKEANTYLIELILEVKSAD